MQLNLTIHNSSKQTIEESFDRIAKELIGNYNLQVNEALYQFTEIEFYYFHPRLHPDTFTHPHDYGQGKWRFHLQGLDITLFSDKESDGGILIRGIKDLNPQNTKEQYVNGPKRVLEKIFKSLGNVTDINKKFGLIPSQHRTTLNIYKNFRHGLGKSGNQDFLEKKYRYFTGIENWDPKHVSQQNKSDLSLNAVQLQ